MPEDPLTPPSWGNYFTFNFEEAARYARDGLPLDRKGSRMRVIHVPFDIKVLNLIERLLNKNPGDFGGAVDNFVYFTCVLVLRKLAENGVPEEGPLPTPLLMLDQLSREAEDALALKRIAEDNVGMDFVIETAVQAGDWEAVCAQLSMLRDLFSQVKGDSMRRLLEQAQAGRHALSNAVVKINTLPDGALSEEQAELAEWWSEWFTHWGHR